MSKHKRLRRLVDFASRRLHNYSQNYIDKLRTRLEAHAKECVRLREDVDAGVTEIDRHLEENRKLSVLVANLRKLRTKDKTQIDELLEKIKKLIMPCLRCEKLNILSDHHVTVISELRKKNEKLHAQNKRLWASVCNS